MAKTDKILLNSPAGEAVWPKLNEPDTKFNADGEFSVKLRFDPSEPRVAAFIAKLDSLVQASLVSAIAANPKKQKVAKAVSPVKAELDDNGDETGMVLINFKKVHKVTSKKNGKTYFFRVMLYDALLQPLAPTVMIGGGSTLIASFEPYAYFNQKDNEAGISLRLEAVQVLTLKTYAPQTGAAFGFGAVEGGYAMPTSGEEGEDEFAGAEEAPASGTKGDF